MLNANSRITRFLMKKKGGGGRNHVGKSSEGFNLITLEEEQLVQSTVTR